MEPSHAATAADPTDPLQRSSPLPMEVLQELLQTLQLQSAEEHQQVSKAQQPGGNTAAGGGMESMKGQQMDDQIHHQQNSGFPYGGLQQQQTVFTIPGPGGMQQPGSMVQSNAATSVAMNDAAVAGPMNPPQTRSPVPYQVLQELLQVLKLPPSAEQQQQVLSILKANPPLMAAFIKQRKARQSGGNAAAGGGMDTMKKKQMDDQIQNQQNTGFPQGGLQQQQHTGFPHGGLQQQLQNVGFPQRGMQQQKHTTDFSHCGMQQQQQNTGFPHGGLQPQLTVFTIPGPGGMQQAGSIVQPNATTSTPMTDASVAGPMNPPQSRSNIPQQTLQELLQALKLPRSPEQHQQVLCILKANPQLMAAFIRQRKTQNPGWKTKRLGGKSPGGGGDKKGQ